LVWKTDRRLSLYLVGLTLAAGGLPAGIAYVAKVIIDGVTLAVAAPGPAQRHIVLQFLGLELGLISALMAVQRSLAVADALLRVRLAQQVMELVLEKTLDLSLADFEDAGLYDQLRQAREQATRRPLSLVRRALTALQLTANLLGFLALLAAFSPWIMILLVAAALPAVLIEARFNSDSFRLYREHSPEARRQEYLETVLSREDHAKEVALLGIGRILLGRHRHIFEKWFRADRALTVRRGAWGFGLALIGAGALGASYAWVVWKAMLGAVTIGTLAMLLAVLRQAQNATTELLLVIAGMYDDNAYVKALQDFLRVPTRPANTATSGPLPGDGLRFESVGFMYPGATEPALRALDLHLPPGTKLAVAGRNGAGKSTFVKLALGLYEPTSGRVLLDGRDLRDWEKEALRQRFSVLFQDFVRYQLPAMDNIAFGDLAHQGDPTRVAQAARQASIHDVIRALPQGYETQLGHWFEGGHELSLGEWQKIALARVFMRREADIVVLDEPTANLDARAETELFEQFCSFGGQRSAILISHRLAALRAADMILMLDQGCCVERGNHDALIAAAGAYAKLFRAQFAGDE